MTWKLDTALGGRVANRSGWRRILALLATLSALNVLPASAQDAGNATTVEEATDEQALQQVFDLGAFEIRELRPTRNETVKIQFTLHLRLSEMVEEALAERLPSWQHRLRDQVITGVRTAETVELSQPDLGRLRRKILLRINRLLKTTVVEDVLFTSFTFRLE